MRSRRIFFAVWPPETVRQRLWNSLAPLRDAAPGVRWIPPDRYHVTLRFMGDVDDASLPRLVRAAEALASEPPFRARVAGNGTFPRRGVPRVHWVGLKADPLVRLRDLLDRELASEGFAAERRAFRPHLTIGRTKRGRLPAGTQGGRQRKVELSPGAEWFRVEAVHIVQSRLFPDGPRYANVHGVALKGTETMTGGSRWSASDGPGDNLESEPWQGFSSSTTRNRSASR